MRIQCAIHVTGHSSRINRGSGTGARVPPRDEVEPLRGHYKHSYATVSTQLTHANKMPEPPASPSTHVDSPNLPTEPTMLTVKRDVNVSRECPLLMTCRYVARSGPDLS